MAKAAPLSAGLLVPRTLPTLRHVLSWNTGITAPDIVGGDIVVGQRLEWQSRLKWFDPANFAIPAEIARRRGARTGSKAGLRMRTSNARRCAHKQMAELTLCRVLAISIKERSILALSAGANDRPLHARVSHLKDAPLGRAI